MSDEEIISLIESKKETIFEVERHIWNNPECGFRENKTSKYLAEKFISLGYEVHMAGDVPGFYAEADTGKKGPCIMFIGEMDSLVIPDHPEADSMTGCAHSCGHNAQCATLFGAASAFAEEGSLEGLTGKIRFMLVPAEEMIEVNFRENLIKSGKTRFMNGKPEMMNRGMMDGVDMAIMGHASTKEEKHSVEIYPGNNGSMLKTVSYYGKAAHAAGSPHKGINALHAATMGITAINNLRETFREDDYVRVHYIITKGGEISNAIPSEVNMECIVRASTHNVLKNVNDRVNIAMAASAAAIGGTVSIKDTLAYDPFYNDSNINDIIIEAAEEVPTVEHCIRIDEWDTGSTDMGSLAAVMPVAHFYIGGASGTTHGNDYQITHPHALCVDGAKMYVVVARKLLSENAAKARNIVENYKPTFACMDEYLNDLDSRTQVIEGVEYKDDGSVVLRKKQQAAIKNCLAAR